MNDLIKAILKKHRIQTDERLLGVSDLFKALIEICELQKKHDIKIVSDVSESAEWELSNKSKNIAE